MGKFAANFDVRVVLDMDGVLTNFVGGVCKLFGTTEAELRKNWQSGSWLIAEPLNATVSFTQEVGTDAVEAAMWARINDNSKFWEDLEELPWFDRMIQAANDVADEWLILTSPSWCVSSYDGKVRWLKKRFGSRFNHFAISPHKHFLANPSTILVDDYANNVRKFSKYQGRGLLFPAYYNELRAHEKDPMPHVEKMMHEWGLYIAGVRPQLPTYVTNG